MAIVRVEANTPKKLTINNNTPLRIYNLMSHPLRLASSKRGIDDDYIVLTAFKSAVNDGATEAWVECFHDTVINVRAL